MLSARFECTPKKLILFCLQAAYASYLTSPSGYGLLGPSAAAAAITSLASTPTPMPLGAPASTTPPTNLGLVSPRLTPKEPSEADHSPVLSLPPLPPIMAANSNQPSASSDEEDPKKSIQFPSFLPIRQLRLRAQEHLEAANNSANPINKENGFDSSSSPALSTVASNATTTQS